MYRFFPCALLLALSLIVAACTATSPSPPATPDTPAKVEAPVQARLEPQPTPIPISTVSPINTHQQTSTLAPTHTARPTATLVKEGLNPVDCSNCAYDNVPLIGNVEWLELPTVTDDGVLTLRAGIRGGYTLTRPDFTNIKSNITLTDGGKVLFGTVLPPSGSGWSWGDDPGLWIAETHSYQDNILSVRAKIDPKAANQEGLTLCVWTGGQTSEENEVLACTKVKVSNHPVTFPALTPSPTSILSAISSALSSMDTAIPVFDDEHLDRLALLTHDLINEERENHGLSPLEYDIHLALIAGQHSVDMAANGFFAHDNLHGESYHDRYVRHGYACAKREGNIIHRGAENILQGWKFGKTTYSGFGITKQIKTREWFSDEQVAKNAVDSWMGSPGHRKNILNPRWTLEGIGVGQDETGKLLFTQNFC